MGGSMGFAIAAAPWFWRYRGEIPAVPGPKASRTCGDWPDEGRTRGKHAGQTLVSNTRGEKPRTTAALPLAGVMAKL